MISVEEALNKVLDAVSPLGLEKVSILDALGRVLGEDVFAGRAIPPNDNSAMDGYAIRAEDSRGASPENPVRLDVVDEIPAGAVPAKAIGPSEAARIMTGAPLPPGADTVVRMEDTRKDGDRVLVFAPAPKGRNIRRAGDDVRQGEKVIPRGEIIRPAEVGLLASLGRSFILVHQRPLVAIVATGNELAEIDEVPAEGKIVNSNSYALAALVRECGAVPLQIGIARDSRKDLIAKFRAALRADLIISTGGVSVGDYDLVKDIMKEAGNRMQFWQVAMKPGRPLAFGALGSHPRHRPARKPCLVDDLLRTVHPPGDPQDAGAREPVPENRPGAHRKGDRKAKGDQAVHPGADPPGRRWVRRRDGGR